MQSAGRSPIASVVREGTSLKRRNGIQRRERREDLLERVTVEAHVGHRERGQVLAASDLLDIAIASGMFDGQGSQLLPGDERITEAER